MSKKEIDKIFFISFCIEQYKKQTSLEGGAISELFFNEGVINYLSENFDVLHTQSHQWLVEEINNFLHKERK